MNIPVAAFDVPLFLVAVVVLALEVPYWGSRAIHGFRYYLKFRGTRLVICPETHKPAVVEVAARSMGWQAILNDPCWTNSPPDCRVPGSECLRVDLRIRPFTKYSDSHHGEQPKDGLQIASCPRIKQ